MSSFFDLLNPEFVERGRRLFGERFEEVVASFSESKLPVVRVNTLVVSVEDALAYLRVNGVEVEEFKNIPVAFRVLNKSKREITDLEKYKEGWFYLQSPSSMVPVSCMAEEVGNAVGEGRDLLVLDMCAAPGSKTTQLSAMMEGTGKIIANDSSRTRLYQMKSILSQYKTKNIQITQAHGEYLWKKYGPVFDFVLLDAPCSGEGRFRISDKDDSQSEMGDWSLNKVKRLSSLQKQLIFGAVMCLKPGGVLVYSTCTFAPEENEEVVQFALDKFEGAIEVVAVPFREQSFSQGVSSWGGKEFGGFVEKSVRIVPDSIWDGFFVTKIVRK